MIESAVVSSCGTQDSYIVGETDTIASRVPPPDECEIGEILADDKLACSLSVYYKCEMRVVGHEFIFVRTGAFGCSAPLIYHLCLSPVWHSESEH